VVVVVLSLVMVLVDICSVINVGLNSKMVKAKKVEWFGVYLKGKKIDMVNFTGYTSVEVKESLINHDGYDSRINVRKINK
jgi:hypothetical protein